MEIDLRPSPRPSRRWWGAVLTAAALLFGLTAAGLHLVFAGDPILWPISAGAALGSVASAMLQRLGRRKKAGVLTLTEGQADDLGSLLRRTETGDAKALIQQAKSRLVRDGFSERDARAAIDRLLLDRHPTVARRLGILD